MAEKQIIVFIDPSKFGSLLGYEKPVGYRKNKKNLDDGNELVYVKKDGDAEVGEFDQKDAEEASIILVPDRYNLIYTPKVPFKILRHSVQPRALTSLTSNTDNLEGILQTLEENTVDGKSTPYEMIVVLMQNKEDSEYKFEDIYNAIPSYDIPLEELLQEFSNFHPRLPWGESLKEKKKKLKEYMKNKV